MRVGAPFRRYRQETVFGFDSFRSIGHPGAMSVDRVGLQRFGRTHHGVVSRNEARQFGVSPSAWSRWLKTGELEELHPGVAGLVSTPRTLESSIRAAVLACPDGAVASHRSATYLHGCWPADFGAPPVELTVGRGGPRQLEGVVLHRPRDQRKIMPLRRVGIPSTDAMRTLGDLGQVVYPNQLAAIVFGFVRRNIVDITELRENALGRRARGRVGPDVLLEVLASIANENGVVGSELERIVAEAVDRSELPSPQRNFRVNIDGVVMLLDLAWPSFRYSIDLDGAEFHADRFDEDRQRDVLLRTGGWTVDRFTWTHATTRMPWLLQTIRSRLSERGWEAA